MRVASSFSAVVLSLILVVTAQGMAFARGQAPAEGQLILCTGQGAVMIFTDADGRPTSPPQLCVDGMQALFGFNLTCLAEAECPANLSHVDWPFAAESLLHAERPHLSARDPPVV